MSQTLPLEETRWAVLNPKWNIFLPNNVVQLFWHSLKTGEPKCRLTGFCLLPIPHPSLHLWVLLCLYWIDIRGLPASSPPDLPPVLRAPYSWHLLRPLTVTWSLVYLFHVEPLPYLSPIHTPWRPEVGLGLAIGQSSGLGWNSKVEYKVPILLII